MFQSSNLFIKCICVIGCQILSGFASSGREFNRSNTLKTLFRIICLERLSPWISPS